MFGQRLRRWSLLTILVPLLATSTGCLGGCFQPICPDAIQREKQCPALPQTCRNHTYIFIVHGVDPFDIANLNGVCEHLNNEGYVKTHYGQLYHTPFFVHDIRHLHKVDPEARFVLVGFSFGANMVRDIATAVAKDHIPIDLLVYLGGNTFDNVPEDRPANAVRVINILASGHIWNGTTFDDAVNIHYDNTWHFGSPADARTLQTLDEELLHVAARVPVTQQMPKGIDTAPHARLAMPNVEEPEERDEWDFLKVMPETQGGSLHPGR